MPPSPRGVVPSSAHPGLRVALLRCAAKWRPFACGLPPAGPASLSLRRSRRPGLGKGSGGRRRRPSRPAPSASGYRAALAARTHGARLAPRLACRGPFCGPARQARRVLGLAFRPAPSAGGAGFRPRLLRARRLPAARTRLSRGLPAAPLPPPALACPALGWRLGRASPVGAPPRGLYAAQRAAFFRPRPRGFFLGLGLDYRVCSCYTLKLQGGALSLSIEKCLGLWPGRFSFFSPPPPPPPSGGGAQEGTTRSAPLRSKNGTPGFPRARKLHKTGILFNLRRLKKRGGSPPQFVRADRLSAAAGKIPPSAKNHAFFRPWGIAPEGATK